MARRLENLADVRRYLAYLINQANNGKIEPSLAGRLGYLSNLLRACIVDGDLEQRVKRLEAISKREPQPKFDDVDFNHLANKKVDGNES